MLCQDCDFGCRTKRNLIIANIVRDFDLGESSIICST